MLKRLKHKIDRLRHYHWPRLRSRLLGALTPRRSVHSRGLKFTLSRDNWITHYRWRYFNEREPKTLDWIDDHVKDEGVLFDVGANVGVFSIYAALRYPNLKVIAFEPEYSNLHLLKDNIIANELQDRVFIYSIALSDSSGISYLNIQDLTPGAALHTVSDKKIRQTCMGQPIVWREGVATMTLDDFCQSSGLEPNYMKVDVDGNELDILQGGSQVWQSSTFQSIMIEFPPGQALEADCKTLLSENGFQWKPQDSSRTVEHWTKNG